ncbi:polysaccharide deacetylase family protein [Nocardioides stalactiti]|uniref:polysaccharide deacetylase family protein n=1 Tax=Nocardioides stalactiti TaxID=2755356 RepID=UPI0015FFB1B9|nr:polysaccharide deacetylase family protein [Nocardioides stalactiti]
MSSRSPRVLMYHGVDRISARRDPYGMFVTPTDFRDQVDLLLESGFVPVSEQDYLASIDPVAPTPLPRRAVLLTFDDGYAGLADHAAPVLASYGVPSVLYVPSGLLGGSSDWLEPRHRHALLASEDLAPLAAQGMAIGAHGFDHTDLTTLGAADLDRHTRETKAALESVVRAPVRSFAFPFGEHDAASRAAVRDAGFDAAFAVHDGADRFAISRVDVNAYDTLRTFRFKLRSFYPAARRATERVPLARRIAHGVLGRSTREVHEDPVPAGAR